MNENFVTTERKPKARNRSPLPDSSPSSKEVHKEIFSGVSKDDRIAKAVKERKDAGNYLTVVPNAETHEPLPKTISLRLAREYNLRENR
jgi:hypothetical protein